MPLSTKVARFDLSGRYKGPEDHLRWEPCLNEVPLGLVCVWETSPMEPKICWLEFFDGDWQDADLCLKTADLV